MASGCPTISAQALAVGDYLLFLNSDVLVHPHWLPPLVARLQEDETIAAVGPRILNLDGSLQLAGALLLRAGATVTYGGSDDPNRLEYTFSRDVDYCSGACLAVRRSAFDDVGGFDPTFGLIYFEDADLCLRLWQHGLRTVYEPSSMVTHVGGGGIEPGPRCAAPRKAKPLDLRAAVADAPRSLSAGTAGFPPTATCRARHPQLGSRARRRRRSHRQRPRQHLPLGARHSRNTSPRQGPSLDRARGRSPERVHSRRFRFDAVVAATPVSESLGELIAERQPQAAMISVEDILAPDGQLEQGRLAHAAAAAGLAP